MVEIQPLITYLHSTSECMPCLCLQGVAGCEDQPPMWGDQGLAQLLYQVHGAGPLRKNPGWGRGSWSACLWLGPYALTGLLPWVTKMYLCHRGPPEAPTSERGHRGRDSQEARMAPSASFINVLPKGGVDQGHNGTDAGKCLVILGAGYTVFPKHGSRGLPVRPLQKRLRAP